MKITLTKNNTVTGLTTDSLVWLWENVGVGNVLPTDYPDYQKFSQRWELADKNNLAWCYGSTHNGFETTEKFVTINDDEMATLFMLVWT